MVLLMADTKTKNTKKPYWQHYHHPADMGIKAFGNTRAQAFQQAALAMTAIIADLKSIQPEKQIQFACQRLQDDEMLFIEFLNRLLYEMSARNMLFSKFDLTISQKQLSAWAWGETLNPEKHKPTVEVKAATCEDLKVCKDKNGNWLAQCIVDV